MRDLPRRWATTRPNDVAYIQDATRRTWAELGDRSDRLGSVMQGFGLRAGDRAGILATDRLEMIEHWHACLKTGIVRTGINWRYAAAEIAHVVRDGDLRFLLVEDVFVGPLADDIQRWLAEGRVVVGFGSSHALELDLERLMTQSTRQVELVPLAPLDPAALSYTSGTTGLPKGAILTQLGGWTQLFTAPYVGGFRPDDVVLNNLPGSGFPIYLHSYPMALGATAVMPVRFDPRRSIALAQEHGVTVMFCVPTMLNAIEEMCRATGARLPRLRLIVLLGSPIVPAIVERARETLRCDVQNWFGSTEVNGAVCIMQPSDLTGDPARDRALATSVGRPLPHVDLEIRDDDGRPVARGEIGEVCVRGPVLAGYHGLPEETARALVGGWFRMGDVGYQDEAGRVFLTDRKHFMIISGGYNVFPAVVETVLAGHPAVREVAVVGAAHPRWGEAVVAVVVPRDPQAPSDPRSIIDFCAERVGKWEIPKHVEMVDALPVGTTGKIQKREIRRWFEVAPERLPWHAAGAAADSSSATTVTSSQGGRP